MKCPECDGKTWVSVTRASTTEILRRRRCRKCDFDFETVEWIELSKLPKRILEKLEER